MTPSPDSLIRAGAVFNAAFFVFHIAFWRLFDWKRQLPLLTPINRAVMQVLNLCLMCAFLVFAWVSWFHTGEMLATPLGHALLAWIAIFWAIRAAEQLVFFQRTGSSWVFFTIFVIGTLLYAWPLMAV
ncbi:MAG: hypothetical protein HZB13_09415 [Acidobacteria bacterium]|nr:hypothetical protein [Acidobacteriota bacterium]